MKQYPIRLAPENPAAENRAPQNKPAQKRIARIQPGLSLIALILALLLGAAPASGAFALLQRERRPPARPPYVGATVPANGMTIPAGTVIVLRLETRLDSGSSRPSDRFRARVIEAIVRDDGRELVPQGATVEGFVESVEPAQKRRRSGVIAVRFDTLRLPSGRAIPLEGALAAADPDERRRIDEEGQISGGSTRTQTVVFIGGGAGAGAAIGAIAGGAVLGAGVGAAAGVFGAWLAKGKEAVVAPGTRLGVQLTKPLDAGLGGEGITRIEPRPAARPSAPAPSQPEREGTERREELQRSRPEGNPLTEGVLVRWSSVFAERAPNGAVRVSVTAETPSAGWRVYADHAVDRETLEIWLRGNRPAGMAAQVISYPTVSLTVPDDRGAIRRVMVHGTNGERVVAIGPPEGGRGPAEGALGETAARIADKVDVLVSDYAASAGARRQSDGRYEFDPQRAPEDGQIELLFALSNLLDSARLLRGVLGAEATPESRRRGADRLAQQSDEVERRKAAVRVTEAFDRKWRALRAEIGAFVASVR